jgi:hypothetical protein
VIVVWKLLEVSHELTIKNVLNELKPEKEARVEGG